MRASDVATEALYSQIQIFFDRQRARHREIDRACRRVSTSGPDPGAIIAFGCLIWAGLKMMGGRFQDAIPQLFGALFGAGVLGWGAGWIGSLTGQFTALEYPMLAQNGGNRWPSILVFEMAAQGVL